MKSILYALSILLFTVSCNNPTNQSDTKDTTSVSLVNPYDTIPIKPSITEPAASDAEKAAYDKAYQLWYNDKPKESITELRKFIAKYPKSPLADDAQNMLGHAYGSLEDYKRSIEEFQKVKTNYPDANSTPESLYNIAHTYFFSLNDFVKAKYYYIEFLNSATPDNEKFRKISVDQLTNWEQESERFEGYAQRRKEEKEALQLGNPAQFLKVTKENWHRGGFETVGIHDLSIQNTATKPFKDVVIRVLYYSETNTLLGSKTRTIYKAFPANKTTQVKELNTGFIPADAKKASVSVITALPLENL